MQGVYFNENNIQINIQTQNYELLVEEFQGLKFCCILSFSNAIHLSANGTQKSPKLMLKIGFGAVALHV